MRYFCRNQSSRKRTIISHSTRQANQTIDSSKHKKLWSLILRITVKLIIILLTIILNIEDDMNKTVKVILEIVKLVATALLGYYGGNAVM